VTPLGFPLLADENVHPDVVLYLRQQWHDIRSVAEEGLLGHSDLVILRKARADGRVVLTHDSDFGTLVIAQNEPFTGVVYLRPGHIYSEFAIQTLRAVAEQSLDVHPPFIVVAEHKERTVQIRTRQL
jgi:predicted nuclease of predicted toxin-antitoxin system